MNSTDQWMVFRKSCCVGWLLIGALACSRTSLAQQQFTLTENDQWALTKTAEPGTPEAELARAAEALAADRADRALTLATEWIEKYERHPMIAEAYLIRGDALNAKQSYYEALFDYEYVARVYTGSEAFIRALERELDIAKKFATGTKRKMWGMRVFDATQDAEELLILIQQRLPGSRLAEDAGLVLCEFYFSRREMRMAIVAYSLFIENYPHSEQIGTARRRLIYAYLATFKGPEFDARGLLEARARLNQLRAFEPYMAQQIGTGALLTRIDESEARKMLKTAHWYLKTKDYIAAEFTIRRLVENERFHGTIAYTDALKLLVPMLDYLPENILQQGPDYRKLLESLETPNRVISAAALGEDES